MFRFIRKPFLPELLSGRQVLVVEDEMMVMMMVEDMLTDLGCRSISTAATVDQALSLIGEKTFDVASLDVNLNGHKSYPIADALAAIGTPFVFSTGYNDHSTRQGYADRPILQKPFDLQGMKDVLGSLLKGRPRVEV